MQSPKTFPIDFSKEEISQMLSELVPKLGTSVLSQGEKFDIERKIAVCQNQLLFLSLLESNEKLIEQQSTLLTQQQTLSGLFEESTKSNKRTGKEAKLIIFLAIITLLASSAMDFYHMSEENESLKTMIKQFETVIGLVQNDANKISSIEEKQDTSLPENSTPTPNGIYKQVKNLPKRH